MSVNNLLQSRYLFKKTIFYLFIIEVIYLFLFNLTLNLPLTQTLVNKIKPEKFQVHWDSAWTLYPFRAHASGIHVKGQSRTQKWQAHSKKVSASISLLPLIRHKVNLYNLQAVDLEYSQQSLALAEQAVNNKAKNNTKVNAKSTIEHKTGSANKYGAAKKQRKPWHISLQTVVATGNHHFSIAHVKGEFQGKLQGTLQADLTIQTRGGPFSISKGAADVILESFSMNGDQDAIKQGYINGLVEIAPIVFKQNKGLKILEFLKVDADIRAQLGSLDFLELYLEAFKGMQIDGHGQLAGHLRFDKGTFLQDTDLKIDASSISLSLLDHKIDGNGLITADVSKDRSDELNMVIKFASLDGYNNQIATPLFNGHDLSVTVIGRSTLFPLKNRKNLLRDLLIEIPRMEIGDLNVYQLYIPDKWKINLYGGEGTIQGKAKLSTSAFNAELKIDSTDADVGVDENRFKTNLDFGLFVNSPFLESAKVDISGTYLRLDDSKLSVTRQNITAAQSIEQPQSQSQSWQTSLMIDKGVLQLHLPEESVEPIEDSAKAKQFSNREKQQQKLNNLLADADAQLKVSGHISQLEWISLLLKNSLNMNIGGSGTVLADLRMASGWLAKDSYVKIASEKLTVGIMDYHFKGDGLVNLKVIKGGNKPDVDLKIDVTDALLNRTEEEQAFIENVELKLNGTVRELSYKGSTKELMVHLQIPSAHVMDMSVYNYYFPENSPLLFSAGEASLSADVILQPESAQGFVRLKTHDLQMSLDDQEISAELKVDVNLSDGVPRDMQFDISGSSINLDQVRVIGEQKSFDQNDWYAAVNLTKATTRWKQPIVLHADTEVMIKDSRPFVAMLSNQRKKHGWLSKLLTIENVKGKADIDIKNNEAVIPYAFINSDKIDLGAKGVFNAQFREGLFYARFKRFKGLLKVTDDKKNFDVYKAKNQFDKYSPVHSPIPLSVE